MEELTVLGIETSCDETAAAIVRLKAVPNARPEILANVVLSQIEDHAPYGGVVPEIAARAHVAVLDRLVETAMKEAGLDFETLSGIAATAGPGLIGGVLVGLTTAKAIAAVHGLPLLAVNHLEGHALSARLTERVDFPYLLLLVSGGHCQLLRVEGPGKYRRYGTTIDDAAGEAFDKTAKLLGLGFPGGPAIERAAQGGNATAYSFPRPLTGREGADFSFAGLKTAVVHAVKALSRGPNEQESADIAASFQAAVIDVLAARTEAAMQMFSDEGAGAVPTLVVAGGVAANAALRARLEALAKTHGFSFAVPPVKFCTDNAAMIAWAGIERLRLGLIDDLSAAARPRWPLDEMRAGHGLPHQKGLKGPKA
ncbi:MAG: tRNA (adenosine(37)-N6)-threonylcarbamoyltransferase complex transferase subunit TsaD [Alphaproteobacteria bacterium]